MNTHTKTAWSDAAAFMVALAGGDDDRAAGQAALSAMIESGDVAELSRTLFAALDLGATLLKLETADRDDPGPLLEYVVAVSRHASKQKPR